jgi:hypothetical protein
MSGPNSKQTDVARDYASLPGPCKPYFKPHQLIGHPDMMQDTSQARIAHAGPKRETMARGEPSRTWGSLTTPISGHHLAAKDALARERQHQNPPESKAKKAQPVKTAPEFQSG